jgi:subfamily B ATP-binding cassette protein MsbA
MEALENLMAGRTVIIIAHRLSTIQNVDKIVVLANGKIAEQGTHEELMKKGKMYEELYTVQGWPETKS